MGLDTDRFIEAPLPDLVCKICKKVVQQPIECSVCQQSFCEPCIRHWHQEFQQCPNSCTLALRPSHPILASFLNTLKIRCVFASRGCSAIVRLKDLSSHEASECDYRLVTCPHEGCDQQFAPAQHETHLEECMHQLTACTACGFQLKKLHLPAHNCVASIMTCIQTLTQQAQASNDQLQALNTLVKTAGEPKHEGAECSECHRRDFVGVRSTCLSCPGYSACWKCLRHHEHKTVVQLDRPGIHEAVICDGCRQTNIPNFRFKCLVCEDFGKE